MESVADAHDGYNVVFHEFAHQLDDEAGIADGAPQLPEKSMYADWSRVLGAEYEALVEAVERHRPTLLDEYGAESPAEFFAVATEAFFELPGGSQGRCIRSSTSSFALLRAGSRIARYFALICHSSKMTSAIESTCARLKNQSGSPKCTLGAATAPGASATTPNFVVQNAHDVARPRRNGCSGSVIRYIGWKQSCRVAPIALIQYSGLYSSTYVNPRTFGSKNMPVPCDGLQRREPAGQIADALPCSGIAAV